MPKVWALRGRLLTPVGAERAGLRYLNDALVVITDGKLTYVGPACEAGVRGVVHDVRPGVMVPGFVDTHLHFPQTRIVGSAGRPLLTWLSSRVFPEEARLCDEAYARTLASEFTARLVGSGTTTSAIFSSSDEGATRVLFHALAESGLRATAGLTLMDQGCPAALSVPREAAREACLHLIAEWHGHDDGRLEFAITPRFALSCSRKLMEEAAELACTHGLLIQTHLAENVDEVRAVASAHAFGKDYLGIYEAVGLVGQRTVLAHAVHLSECEWDRIATRGARVAHCPDSNFFLGSGRMPLSSAQARGIAVGLGSDVGAGRSYFLGRAMSAAYDNALCLGHRISAAELFRMATLGGAEVLGLGQTIGSLEAGKSADIVVLKVPEQATSFDDVLSAIAFSGETAVMQTIVRGKKLSRSRALR